MLQLLTSNEFAEWFEALDDASAEDVATALEVIAQLGPTRAAPGSRESLLWYEHPSVSRFDDPRSIAWELEAWGSFRDYTSQITKELESPRFVARLARLPSSEADTVFKLIKRIKREADPRTRWTLKMRDDAACTSMRPETACDDVRRIYLEVLDALAFVQVDVPAHSLALREVSRRDSLVGTRAFRLLYGVHTERETALVALGEWLDRSFYGDSVRRAERMWTQFLNGELQVSEVKEPELR